MKKNLLALLLLLTMIVNIFAMASCDLLPGNQNNENDDQIEIEGKINISFYHTMGANLTAVLNPYIDEFEKLYPNIHIMHQQVGSYDDVRDQVSLDLTEGVQPNLTYCYPDHVALYNVAMAVVTLDEYIDFEGSYTFADGVTVDNIGLTQAQKDDFIKAYYEEGRQFGDGKMYTLPLSKSTEVLYYNKTFFEQHKDKISVPTTWDEMEAVCKAIKEIDPTSIPLGYDSEANWFITMCEQLKTPYTSATGENFLFDDAANHAFVKRFAEWYAQDLVTTQDLYGAYTSGLFVATSGQRSYMSIGSSAGATHQAPVKDDATGEYPFEVGIAPIPQADSTNNKVISQGPSLCILASGNADEDMATWLFIKYLTTNVGFQAEFSEASGYVPVIKSVAEDELYQEFLASANGNKTGIAALSAKVCLEQESYYYTSPAFNGSSTARDEVGALLQTCFTQVAEAKDAGKTDAEIMAIIEKAFDDAVAECKYQVGK